MEIKRILETLPDLIKEKEISQLQIQNSKSELQVKIKLLESGVHQQVRSETVEEIKKVKEKVQNAETGKSEPIEREIKVEKAKYSNEDSRSTEATSRLQAMPSYTTAMKDYDSQCRIHETGIIELSYMKRQFRAAESLVRTE